MTQQPCLLIVEADILARHSLAEYLRECGYRVLEASNTEQARDLLGQSEFTIDVVLADVNSPVEGGFALAKWIRVNRPGVRVILAGTVERAAQEAGDLCEEGPNLSKPYDHQIVVNHIRRLIADRSRVYRTQT